MKDKVTITLKDNQQPNHNYCFLSDYESDITCGKLSEKSRKAIESLSSINKLLKVHQTIVIPPKARFKNEKIIEIRNSKLYTYNWIGVIAIPNMLKNETSYRIEITSRFDDSKKQYFLLYLLGSVYGFNIFDTDINCEIESNYIIILIVFYLHQLIEAYRDGLYKEYIIKKHNNHSFKGAMDTTRHLKLNTPFVGKTAYTVREYTYDNEILCLMRQVITYISCNYSDVWYSYSNSESILNEIVEVIENATLSYRMTVNYAEAVKCRREIAHPMYQRYEVARKLALMILNESGQNIFEDSEDLSFSLLIDIAWLWEEFVAERLLKEYNYKHLSTDGAQGSLKWASQKPWYPDFIEKAGKDERLNIFDAKYKSWDWDKNEDIHQLLSYLFLSGGNICGIIYPSNNEEEEREKIELYAFADFYQDKKPSMYKLPLIIPQAMDSDYLAYCKKMDESIKSWKDYFQSIIN